ncbi:DNA-binding protein YbaB [Catenuloplanes nepalensis]|uniref:DNA-binding protein YbaB n=1 Tax=Catenuloplanes nepalensis TaxID=587533 RepID=A0ABT9MQR6_9ACTN|nr:YbaB/EbfC family nucleoid-associated protein [Catenuloplanes nepalensis]MDP9793775.1 DNA-binding protein YbaB [Catenuloplanes nepalensis]
MDAMERLAEVRAGADAAGGLVRVEVDGAGQVTDVWFDPRAMRLASADLAEAVLAALRQAQAAAREQAAGIAVAPAREEYAAASARAVEEAERRMAQITSMLDGLVRRSR